MEIFGLLFGLLFIILFVLIMRLLGSWMLRINELIDLQQSTLNELKKIRLNTAKD
jgi:uncharacterized membrane protein required for colicin V production